jgi:hypothetical protein
MEWLIVLGSIFALYFFGVWVERFVDPRTPSEKLGATIRAIEKDLRQQELERSREELERRRAEIEKTE